MVRKGVLLGAVVCAAMVCLAGAACGAETALSAVAKGPDDVVIRSGDRTVLEYRAVASPMKPYVRELFTPGGVEILRDSPHDHKHHHGWMFAVGVNGVDFWTEIAGCGQELVRGQPETKVANTASGSRASLCQGLDWTAPDGKKLLEEQRTITALAAADLPATLVTWRSRLSAPEGMASVTLGGAHYFGLGMRFVESMDKAGEFITSERREGTVVRGSERLTPARWCAYTSSVDGKPVTVAMFDDPENRRPALFFTMRPFAYLSATLNLWKEPMAVKAGSPVELCYGVAVWDGHVDSKQIEAVYEKWLKLAR